MTRKVTVESSLGRHSSLGVRQRLDRHRRLARRALPQDKDTFNLHAGHGVRQPAPKRDCQVNITGAIVLSYTFDRDKHYTGDPDMITDKIDAVTNQSKAKK